MNNKLLLIHKRLLARYGDPQWWPAKTPYEVIVGAVLTQNTAWSNVEKAIANFGENLSPETVDAAEFAELTAIIRPAGFFVRKAGCLKAVTAWFAEYGCDAAVVRKEPVEKLREELLSIKGVGPETADSILLYAFDFPTFVVDAYTIRLCDRFPVDAGGGYAEIKAYFESRLPRNAKTYNGLHARIVINAKKYCRRKPLCENCPLSGFCERRGL